MGRLVGLVLVTVLVASGCSADAEPEAGPDDPASSGPSSSSTPTSSEPPEPEPVDPCSLLTADDLAAAGIRGETERSTRGFAPDPYSTVCQVPDPKKGWAIYYGYSTRPGVKVADAVEQVGTEKPVRLSAGDDARLTLYAAYGDRIWHAWASEGPTTVMVQTWSKPKPKAVEGLLTTMLEQASPEMFDFPVDLPPGCPKPTTKAITALLGKVATATGSALEDDLRCTYATSKGLALDLGGSPLPSARKAQQSLASVAEFYEEREEVARGVTLLVSPGEGYAFTGTYVSRPPGYLSTGLQSMTVVGRYYRALRYDAEKYRALSRWWSTQRPDVLG